MNYCYTWCWFPRQSETTLLHYRWTSKGRLLSLGSIGELGLAGIRAYIKPQTPRKHATPAQAADVMVQ
jgi:hypothetical protein